MLVDAPSIFAGIAAQFGSVFSDAVLVKAVEPVRDTGGSIVHPVPPSSEPCRVQVDRATDAMRADAGFVTGDVRLLILGPAVVTTEDRVRITAGEHAGAWRIMAVERDPAAIGWDCRGRRAS